MARICYANSGLAFQKKTIDSRIQIKCLAMIDGGGDRNSPPPSSLMLNCSYKFKIGNIMKKAPVYIVLILPWK
jgi:hypothetical protein